MRWPALQLRETAGRLGRGSLAAADRFFRERAILLIGWIAFLGYAYPGFMSYDSVWQLSQARGHGPINDWHPPLMTYLWRLTDSVIAGPFPMLVIQSTAFLLGLYALLKRAMSPRAAAIVAVVLLLIPQNIIVMAVIWKDSQMAGYLVAAIACLLSEKRRWQLAGLFFIFLATGVRYNAAAATFAIVMLLWGWHAAHPWLRRYATAAGVWLAVTVAAFVVNGQLVEEKSHVWQIGAAPVDIVGTIRFSHDLDNAELLRETEGVPWVDPDTVKDRIRKQYRPTHTFLEIQVGENRFMDYIQTPEQRAAITRAWKKLVLGNPFAFLWHRHRLFRAVIDTKAMVWAGFVNDPWAEESLKHRATHSKIQLPWVMKMVELSQTELFRVRLYLFLSLALLPFCRRQRLPFVLLGAGICHEIGLFLVAPAIDYRYSHWMVLCAIVGAILLFVARLRGKSALGDRRGVERAA